MQSLGIETNLNTYVFTLCLHIIIIFHCNDLVRFSNAKIVLPS